MKKRKLATSASPAAWSLYPPPCSVPRDPVDPRFTFSFDVSSLLPRETYSTESEGLEREKFIAKQRQNVQTFYERYGFVVFSHVLSDEECTATEAEIWVCRVE